MALLVIVASVALLGPLSKLAADRLPAVGAAQMAAGGVGLILLGWLALWPALPVSLNPLSTGTPLFALAASRSGSWQLGGALLLLAAAGLLRLLLQPGDSDRQASAILALLPPLLFTVWNGLAGLPLLALSWSTVVSVLAPAPGRFRSALMGSLVGFFPIWLGTWLDGPSWLPLLGVAWYLGAFPLHWWRPLDGQLPPAVAPLLFAAFPAAGLAALFALPVPAAAAGPWLGAAAIGGLLWGIADGWRCCRQDAQRAIGALATSVAGMVLLSWLWGGAEMARAGGIALLLAPGALLLASAPETARRCWRPQQLPALLAALALAGAPLFSGRAALFEALLRDGHVLLPVALALLHLPLTAVALLIVLNGTPADGEPALWRGMLPVLPPIVGLLLLAGPAARATPMMGLVIVLLPLALGTVAALRLDAGRLARSEALLDLTAAQLRRLSGPGRVAREAVVGLGRATREAGLLLEGEGGLLWLLFLLVIFGLARL